MFTWVSLSWHEAVDILPAALYSGYYNDSHVQASVISCVSYHKDMYNGAQLRIIALSTPLCLGDAATLCIPTSALQ